MSLSALELIHIQYSGLYNLDEHGRMLSLNEPGTPSAPRFFMGRTAQGHLIRFHAELPDDLARSVAQICAAEPITDDLEPQPRYTTVVRSLFGVNADSSRGPAFRFPAQILQIAGAVLIEPEQAGVLTTHFVALANDYSERTPITAFIVDGVAVAVCCDARRRDVSGEAGVETVEAFRGRGYAAAAVSLWAQIVHAQGRIPLYSTSWENSASRAIARKLGLILFGEDWEIC
jgi:RimJ/RimL family protein N-acetyltransferase